MKVRSIMLVPVLSIGLSLSAFAQDRDNFDPGEAVVSIPPMSLAGPGLSPAAAGCGVTLFDNGPVVNSAGTGAGGADESILQTDSLGMGTFGFGHQIVDSNSVSDDFVVAAPGWNLDCVVLYAYQTGSSTTSTIDDIRVQVWNGVPGAPGSAVIFGDLTTNRLLSTSWSGAFRVTESTTGVSTDRPIMMSVADLSGLSLIPGTYWIEWMVGGTLVSGPWAPPITITGTPVTGNGVQGLAGVYQTALDDGVGLAPQGFPFVLQSSTLPEAKQIPTTGIFGLAMLALAMLSVAGFRLRGRP